MQTTGQNNDSNERRKYNRLSIYSFMHATATLSDSVSAEQKEKGLYWTGLIEDISYDGAQIILPKSCEGHLKEHQDVRIEIKTTFIENLDADAKAQVIYIAPAESHQGMQVGIQFKELASNPQAQDSILKICEYGKKLIASSQEQSNQMAGADN